MNSREARLAVAWVLGMVFVFSIAATALAAGPTEVWVDGDWVGTESGIDVLVDDETYVTFGSQAFATIAEAIAAVDQGATIHVAPGVYTESIIASKGITLLGAKTGLPAGPNSSYASRGSEESVINGTVTVTGNAAVTVDGFTINGGDGAGIYTETAYAHIIKNNIVTGNKKGIATKVVGGIQILTNRIFVGTHAIELDGNPGTPSRIDGNYVTDSGAGLVIMASLGNGHTITNNVFVDNGAGVVVAQGGHNISGNLIEGNDGAGVMIYNTVNTNNNAITDNVIIGNGYGIWLYNDPKTGEKGATGNYAHDNDLSGNTVGVLNGHAAAFDATGNYWGVDDIEALVNSGDGGGVVFDPWFMDDARTTLASSKPAKNVEKSEWYDSIQGALDAAANGNTILVSAGEHYESIVIPQGKQGITLQGQVSGSGATRQLLSTIKGGDDNFARTIMLLGPNSTVQDLIIEKDDDNAESGMGIEWSYTGSGSTVTGNIIRGNLTGMYLVSGLSNATITDNLITGNANGILFEGMLSSTTVSGNTITGNNLEDAYWTDKPNAGIRVLAGYVGTEVSINRNSILEVERGIDNNSTPSSNIDARGNWWGVENPSDVAELAGSLVDYDPWYTDSSMSTSAMATGKDIVNLSNLESYATIQAAIDDAEDGDLIQVAAGVYDGNVMINKPRLTLVSAVVHGAEIRGNVTISANNVRLNGFKITNFAQVPTPDYSGVYIFSGTGVVVENNLIDGEGLDPATYLTVGIHTLHGATTTVTAMQNTIQNVRMGIYNQGTTLTAIGNTITAASHCAIGVDGKDTTIIGGTIAGGDTDLEVYGTGEITLDGVSFSGGTKYIALMNSGTKNIDATNCTFDDVSPASATVAQLAEIENKIDHLMDTAGKGLVMFKEATVVATKNNRGLQTVVSVAQADDAITVVAVAAGQYDDHFLTITKPLTLLGANAGIVPIFNGADSLADRGSETILTSGGPYVIQPNASDITIDGFKFTGGGGRLIDTYADSDNLVITNCIFDTSSGATAAGVIGLGDGSKDNLQIDHNAFVGEGAYAWLYLAGTSYEDTIVSNNHFGGNSSRGIFQAGEPLVDPLIEGNYFGPGIVTGINMGKLDNPTIQNNTFDGVKYAAMQVGTHGGVVQGNVLDGAGAGRDFGDYTLAYGIQLWGGAWGTWTCEGVEVTNNTIANYRPSGTPGENDYYVGIYLSDNDGDPLGVGPNVTVSGNTIEDNAIGVRVNSNRPGLSVTGNAIVRNAVGILYHGTRTLDATRNYWGTGWSSPASQVVGNVDCNPWYVRSSMRQQDLSNYVAPDDDDDGGTPSIPPPTPPQPPVIAGAVSQDIPSTQGGTVALEDNSAKVELPAGAVQENVTITLSPVVEMEEPTTGMVMIGGKVYEITAETVNGERVTTFSQPLTLTFTFTQDELEESGTNPEDLKVFYWDAKAGAWIALPTTVDPVTGTVSAITDHFTLFALMAKPGMPSLKDIAGHWAETHVLRLVSLGVAGGYEDGSYKPENVITREEFAKMVVLAAGLEADAEPILTFVDAEEIQSWARGYVSAAVNAGIITGLPENKFGPTELVTRQQAATMIGRALGVVAGTEGGSTTFADDTEIESWARSALAVVVSEGIITGYPDNTFRPEANTTRAEAAAMLSKLMVVMAE